MDAATGNVVPLRPSRTISWPEALLLAGLVLLSLVSLVAGALLVLYGVPPHNRHGVLVGSVVQPASAAQEGGGRFAAAAGSSVVIASADAHRRVLATLRADAGGLFRVQLRPGSYVISVISPRPGVPAKAWRIELLGGQALTRRLELAPTVRAADLSAPR
jgi:hypothetical protein